MCIEDFSPDLISYEERLLSFVGWPKMLSPALLARAGFYYTGEKDIVKCFYCNSEWHNWDAMDDPLSDHIRDSPYCCFAKLLAISRSNERYRLKMKEEEKISTKYFKDHITTTKNRGSYTPKTVLFFFALMCFLNLYLLFFKHKIELLW